MCKLEGSVVVAVTGGSGSGKSELSRLVAQCFARDDASVWLVQADRYWKTTLYRETMYAAVKEQMMRCEYNRDDPDHYDHDLLVSDLEYLAQRCVHAGAGAPAASAICGERRDDDFNGDLHGLCFSNTNAYMRNVCVSVCVCVGARSLTWTLSGALTRCECVGNTNSARPRSAPALFLVEGILILECSRLREVEANLPHDICLLHVSVCERDVCEREFRRLSISFNPVVSHSLQRICLQCSCAGCSTASICRH